MYPSEPPGERSVRSHHHLCPTPGFGNFGKREQTRRNGREMTLWDLLESLSPALSGSAQRCLQPFCLCVITTHQTGGPQADLG